MSLKEKMSKHLEKAKAKKKAQPALQLKSEMEDLPREEREALFVQARDSFCEFAKQHLEQWVPFPTDPASQILVDLYGKENLYTYPHYSGGAWVVALVPEVLSIPSWDWELNRTAELLKEAQRESVFSRLSDKIRQEMEESLGRKFDRLDVVDHRFRECIPYFGGLYRKGEHGHDPYGYEEVEFRFSRLSQEFRSRWVAHRVANQSEGQIPVMRALREGSFSDCPTMGRKRTYADPMALCNEGVVVPYKGSRYRLKFNWDALCEADNLGLQQSAPDVLSHISFEKTTDPSTKQSESKDWSTSLQVFGKGQSQQDDIAPLLDGKLPACLAVFEYGHDFTWTVMAHLDDDGLPYAAWLEGSCT